MPFWIRRNYTRWDLWAVPGFLIMIIGLVIQINGDSWGSVILFVGIVLNTIYVLRRTRRDQKW